MKEFKICVCARPSQASVFLAIAVFSATLGMVEIRSESIENLVSEALASNPEIQFYKQEIEHSRKLGENAGALPDPQISGSFGHVQSTGGGQARADGLAWSVGITQNFEWPGRRRLRRALADGQIQLAETGLRAYEAALAARVRGEAYKLESARGKARASREVAERYRMLRETLVQRDLTGITPKLELRILEATELSLRQKAIDAEIQATGCREQLNFLLGRNSDSAVDFADESNIDSSLLPGIPEVSELIGMARASNFEFLMHEVHIRQQGIAVELAHNGTRPSISVGPQLSEQNGQSKDITAGIGISIALPVWRKSSADIGASRIREDQARTMLDIFLRELMRDIELASAKYRLHRQEIQNWDPELVEAFREAAQLADRHYRLGAVNSTTYIEMQNQYLEAVQTFYDAQFEAIEAASKLEELTGIRLLGMEQEKLIKASGEAQR